MSFAFLRTRRWTRVLLLSPALGLSALFIGCGLLTENTALRSAVPFSREGKQITVPAGGDFQGALNAAQPGDTILLTAGATYQGQFTLPAKSGNEFITIQTSAIDRMPPPNTRARPQDTQWMPKLVCSECPVIQAAPGAHHYRLIGLEIHPTAGLYAPELLAFGSPTAKTAQEQPSNIELDRLVLRGDEVKGSKRGVALNARTAIVRNSWFGGFWSDFQDAQAIVAWNGPGPFRIENNHLEGSGEAVLFGGAAPSIQGLVPSDIDIVHNHFFKPLEWKSKVRNKNLLELKSARRVRINGNIFENNWHGAQGGSGILFTVRTCEGGNHLWSVVEDVQFTHNLIKNSEGGVNVMGQDDDRERCPAPGTGTITSHGKEVRGTGTKFTQELKTFSSISFGKTGQCVAEVHSDDSLTLRAPAPADVSGASFSYYGFGGQTSRIVIADNLFVDAGLLYMVLSGVKNITFDHNTGFQTGHILVAEGPATAEFVFTNNIAPHNTYGVFGSNAGSGNGALKVYFPGAVFKGNILAGGPADQYPADNYFPKSLEEVGFVSHDNHRLGPKSPYKRKGTDGRDPGADIDALERETAGVVEGTAPAK